MMQVHSCRCGSRHSGGRKNQFCCAGRFAGEFERASVAYLPNFYKLFAEGQKCFAILQKNQLQLRVRKVSLCATHQLVRRTSENTLRAIITGNYSSQNFILFEGKLMKKTLLVASLLVVALAACSKKEEVVAPAPAPAAAAPAAAAPAPADTAASAVAPAASASAVAPAASAPAASAAAPAAAK
jgi:hypothetical protein